MEEHCQSQSHGAHLAAGVGGWIIAGFDAVDPVEAKSLVEALE